MSIRDSFVERFGELEAQAIEAACDYHILALGPDNPLADAMRYLDRQVESLISGQDLLTHKDDNRGSDPFQYAVLAVMGYECVSKYAMHHGITVSELDFDTWVMECAHLETFDGDPPDYLHMMIGALGGQLGAQAAAEADTLVVYEKEKNDDDSD